jgi:hypothetical protein
MPLAAVRGGVGRYACRRMVCMAMLQLHAAQVMQQRRRPCCCLHLCAPCRAMAILVHRRRPWAMPARPHHPGQASAAASEWASCDNTSSCVAALVAAPTCTHVFMHACRAISRRVWLLRHTATSCAHNQTQGQCRCCAAAPTRLGTAVCALSQQRACPRPQRRNPPHCRH